MPGYRIPKLFQRITNKQSQIVKHFIDLREKKQYRLANRAVMIQGRKTIDELYDRGVKMKSLIVTAKNKPETKLEIHYPASYVMEHAHKFPAEKYYVTDVNITRKILGTASKPDNHDIFAEAEIPNHDFELTPETDRLLVLDGIKDPGNVGTLVRTAQALGWGQGLVTVNSCDLFNDKVIRASRAVSLSWPHKVMNRSEWMSFLKKSGFVPIVADMLPANRSDVWSPEPGSATSSNSSHNIGFWNFEDRPKELPKKIALVLSSEHHGVKDDFDHEIKVSVPMHSSIESLNVAIAGGILMSSLNKYFFQK
ncbi:MAG: Alpha/beta knot methyltransferase [Benjaminiella poitrasii]|nr:MAG: Alpha/beta knot methyltransferase [Benjaminiella poitrasii]